MQQVAEAAPMPAPPREDLADSAPNLAPPPGNPRFPLFDSLRALAALSVFLGHTVTSTYTFAQHHDLFLLAVQTADQGVGMFFLISGFLLYRPFLAARRAGRRYSVAGFARRRVLRIVPAYWVALSILLVAGLAGGVTTSNWWVFYGFGQTYSASTIGHGIGVAWTLCTEVTFYVALPFIAIVASRLGRKRSSVRGDVALLLCLSVASLAFRAHFHVFADFPKISTLAGTFVWFALGMGLAVLSVVEEDRNGPSWVARVVTRCPTLLWGAALAGSVLLYVLFRTLQSVALVLVEHVLYGVIAFLILLPGVFGESAGGLPRRILQHRALAWIGLVSYAFYLYHSAVLAELNQLVSGLHGPGRYLFVLLVGGVVSCACAAASYYVVERPMMRLRPLSARARRRSPS